MLGRTRKRVVNRKKRRMPCQLQVGSSWHSGLVLDLSPSGLFVQTTAKTRPGQRIELLMAAESGEEMALEVEVVRKKVVPARLLALAQGGVGVKIARAPESYFRFLTHLGLGGPALPPEAAEPAPDAMRFRVRISQTSGSRTRRVEVCAADADEAGARALAELGEGWKVFDVEPL